MEEIKMFLYGSHLVNVLEKFPPLSRDQKSFIQSSRQVDFLVRQATFPAHLPGGQVPREAIS